ncbi:hypothetical protein H1230_26080 [Paenibacillus sp. 19GGS1-52]|uniref:hypothetical protein n=1 Tax=Paenibacillus sp. 19GGS1-52 TaxID=2758563 RepID=UPI001EFA98DB|nr:hypothetical protein [Paenibacillus sp. 19GGS1-52]ULO06448.1 hypothetical protein H1230_26080 [Paenibacillus sp. 19GGS1-52]
MTLQKDIYVVLTGTGTAFSGVIRWFTRADLNHASIAFDSELREVYSFGRKRRHNPFVAGLIQENFIDSFYSDADCAVYLLRVSAKEYDTMYDHVQGMMQNQERYKYNLLGLVGVLLHIKIDREDAYFCSHFVASVFEETKVQPVDKPSCFVTPEDFALSLCAYKIFSGKLSYYLGRAELTSDRSAASVAAQLMRNNKEQAEHIVNDTIQPANKQSYLSENKIPLNV